MGLSPEDLSLKYAMQRHIQTMVALQCDGDQLITWRVQQIAVKRA
jgi:hypothetical protein